MWNPETGYELEDLDNDKIYVLPGADDGGPGHPAMRVRMSGRWVSTAYFTPEDAPGLALAVLEAGGHGGAPHTEVTDVVQTLRSYVKEHARDHRLEAFAKELYDACGLNDGISWPQLAEPQREFWRGIARKSDEIHDRETA